MRLALIAITFIFVACQQKLPEKNYLSLDEATGGFYNFSLSLHNTGKLELTMQFLSAIEQNDPGTEWKPTTQFITGKWNIENGKINYFFDEVKPSMDSLLKITDFDFTKKAVLVFSDKLDTAYIYGIPCLEVTKK